MLTFCFLGAVGFFGLLRCVSSSRGEKSVSLSLSELLVVVSLLLHLFLEKKTL